MSTFIESGSLTVGNPPLPNPSRVIAKRADFGFDNQARRRDHSTWKDE